MKKRTNSAKCASSRYQIENTEMWNTSILMNAECYCNFQSSLNVGSRESRFVNIGEDTFNITHYFTMNSVFIGVPVN
jgi:hypothetical protein